MAKASRAGVEFKCNDRERQRSCHDATLQWIRCRRSGCGSQQIPGNVTVKRITCAHDCGLIVNPDGVKNQVEGNIVQGVSRALLEEVTFDGNGVTSLDWKDYPILKFSDILELDIVLINRQDVAPLGAGELATVPITAAIASAIFDATGTHLREVPFTPKRVLAALQQVSRPA